MRPLTRIKAALLGAAAITFIVTLAALYFTGGVL